MASFAINIPDAQVSRVVDALCEVGGYEVQMGSKTAFAKGQIAAFIRGAVVAAESRQISENARVQFEQALSDLRGDVAGSGLEVT